MNVLLWSSATWVSGFLIFTTVVRISFFPHQQNEIAQSEAATGKPFCKYWLHHELLTSGNEKMSKSLGNLVTIREFVSTYSAEVLKFMYLGFHYRSTVPYTKETLEQTLQGLEQVIYRQGVAKIIQTPPASSSSEAWGKLVGEASKVFDAIESDLLMDLNSPGALGKLFAFIREINRVNGEDLGFQ